MSLSLFPPIARIPRLTFPVPIALDEGSKRSLKCRLLRSVYSFVSGELMFTSTSS